MRFPQNTSKQKNSSSLAFTLIEVLVSVLITSIISLIIYISFHNNISIINKSNKKTAERIELLKIDSEIRRKINDIQIPLYESELKVEYSFEDLKIKSKRLETVYFDLSVSHDISIRNVIFIYSDNNKEIGLQIEYEYLNKIYMCRELFGTFMIGAILL